MQLYVRPLAGTIGTATGCSLKLFPSREMKASGFRDPSLDDRTKRTINHAMYMSPLNMIPFLFLKKRKLHTRGDHKTPHFANRRAAVGVLGSSRAPRARPRSTRTHASWSVAAGSSRPLRDYLRLDDSAMEIATAPASSQQEFGTDLDSGKNDAELQYRTLKTSTAPTAGI